MEQTQPPQALGPVPEDISPKTILVLVVLTLFVSFIGAWVNINAAMNAPAQTSIESAQQTAQVSFSIIGQEPGKTTQATGLVAFELTEP
jgi:hypothetical protein